MSFKIELASQWLTKHWLPADPENCLMEDFSWVEEVGENTTLFIRCFSVHSHRLAASAHTCSLTIQLLAILGWVFTPPFIHRECTEKLLASLQSRYMVGFFCTVKCFTNDRDISFSFQATLVNYQTLKQLIFPMGKKPFMVLEKISPTLHILHATECAWAGEKAACCNQ